VSRLIGLGVDGPLTVPTDRDSARWGLSSKMVQRRRLIFWDLFVADAWQVGFIPPQPQYTSCLSPNFHRASTPDVRPPFLWPISTVYFLSLKMAAAQKKVFHHHVCSHIIRILQGVIPILLSQ
jgi:hypothetical protein